MKRLVWAIVTVVFFASTLAAGPAPIISSLSPAFGPVSASVTISGSHFGPSQGTSTVTFNGVAATPSSWGSTKIVASVPAGATTGPVVVTVGGVASNGVSFSVSPSLSSLSPYSGPVGTSVTIAGYTLGASQGTSTVTFNGVAAMPTSWSSTSIVAPVPAGAATGPVVVTVSGYASNAIYFSVAPSVSSLSPTSGPVGTSVTIAGYTFGASQGTSTVTFNGVSATPTSWSSASIVASVPSTAATGPVVVTVGGLASNGVTFSVVPGITSIWPTSGPVGTSVTISGSAFGVSQGNSTVTFNGTVATPTYWSNGSVVAPAPSGATTGPVVVTVGGMASNGVVFTLPPSISSLTPSSGTLGALVTITGLNFGASQGTSTVTFNGARATPTSWSAAQIVAPVPPGATTGQVVVTVNSLASNGVSFTVLPSISNLTPSFGSTGTAVNITGWLFGSSQGTGTVTFNGTSATPTSWTNASIVAPVPAGATTGPVIVTVGGVATNSANFTLTASITGVSPASGNVGTPVTITGADFGATQGTSTVAFNGIPASVTSWGDQSIATSVPAGTTTGPVTVSIGGVTSNGVIFTIAPSITSISPTSGPVGTAVTIVGSGFGGSQGTSNSVSFNSVPATPTSWSGATIVVPVPTDATTGPVVVAVNGVFTNGVTFTVGAGTLTGTVTRSSDGSAVSGALVEALQSNTTKASTSTAADGTYTVSNLPPGTYDVRASATGLGTAIQTGNSVAANATTTLSFVLSDPGTDSGTVTKSDGVTPVSGVTVAALEGSSAAGTATTDAAGSFSIAGLGPGTYAIQASAPGYGGQTQTGVSITAGGTTTTNFSLAGQSVISYIYDDLSRLIGASDSQSNTAVYSYDAVGDLLSITDNPSSQVTIIGFDPQSGPVGASVTVSGTGFSPTASQDTVSFNGTAATITSATATQLVATVPAGATSGTIAVTAPGGSATSSSSFTVTASSGAPTVASFSPTIALTGAAVTITGTNFDTSAGNDEAEINVSRIPVSSATSTSITATVGNNATSGRVSVTTPLGKASSTTDFYVVPPPYTPSAVGFTGRTTLGGTITFNLTAAGQIGLVLFDATAGQRLALLFSTNYAGCGIYTSGTNLTVYNPNGSIVTSGYCLSSGSYLDTQTLPVNGTYMILVAPQSGTSGSVTLTLYNVPPDVIGSITPGGSPVTVATTVPGQNAELTFSGTQNQRISLLLSNDSYAGCGLYSNGITVTISNPDGSTLVSAGCLSNGSFMDTTTLPANGTYTVKVDPSGNLTGSVTMTLYNVPPDFTGTITPGGSPVTVTTTVPGQNAELTFSGTQNQRISLLLSNDSYAGCGLYSNGITVTISNPDGSTLVSAGCLSNGSFIDTTTLPASGTYTIKVDPSGNLTGSVTITLYNVPPDFTGTITPGGSPVTVTTTVPGQNAELTFSGTQNQRVSLLLSNDTYTGCTLYSNGITVTIFNPDGSTLVSGGCLGNGAFFDTRTLPANGTYTIKVDPSYTLTGSVALTLYNVVDVTGSISINGSSLPVTISTPGQNAEITFSGTSGQSVTVQLSGNSICTVSVSLLPPGGGSALTSTSTCNAAFNLASQTLPSDGTYTVLIDPQGISTGSITVSVTSP
jgi:YD repeat-containing protein